MTIFNSDDIKTDEFTQKKIDRALKQNPDLDKSTVTMVIRSKQQQKDSTPYKRGQR